MNAHGFTGLSITGYVLKKHSFGDDRIDAATIFLTVFTNIILTGIICWRLLRGHRQLSDSMPMAKHGLYTGAVSVLVESAAPVALFGLGYGIVTAIRHYMDAGYAFTVFTLLFQTAFVSATLRRVLFIVLNRDSLCALKSSYSESRLESHRHTEAMQVRRLGRYSLQVVVEAPIVA